MLTNAEIEAGAASFARTLKVANGRTSFDFAVRAHLPWFAALLERGLGWNGIVRVLTAAGVTRDDGRALSRGHISAVYWRQFHSANSTERVAAPPQDAVVAPTHPSRSGGRTAAGVPRTAPGEPPPAANRPAAADHAARPTSAPAVPAETTQSGDVRGYMRRALASRRRGDDGV